MGMFVVARHLFTETTAAATHPGLQMAAVRAPCRLGLDADAQRLLRDCVAVVERLEVEQHPDRYRGGMAGEPRRFEEILVGVLDTVREVRAGSCGTTTESE